MNLQRFLTVLLSLVCYQLSFAQLAPQAKAPLLEHMTEVNAQWETQSKYLPQELLATPVQFRSDNERISRHLQLVEFALRNKKTDLTNNSHRTALLELLNQYWNRGLYPINLYHKERTPYFIDHKSTACAVGYLIQKSGHEDFAARVAKENNYAYIFDMQYPELDTWAATHGFSKQELAWIQPGYPAEYSWETLGTDSGLDGDVHCMLTDEDNGLLYMAGQFSDVDNTSDCGSVVAWDGTYWTTLGQGIDGQVYSMELFDGSLYIAGDFDINGSNSNLAYWDGSNWQSVGEFNDAVLALETYNCGLYIGGNFTQIDNQNHSYIAVWNGASISQEGSTCGQMPPLTPTLLSFNAPVTCFTTTNDELLIGGEFTAYGLSNSVTNYMIGWTGSDWGTTYLEGAAPVVDLAFSENDYYRYTYVCYTDDSTRTYAACNSSTCDPADDSNWTGYWQGEFKGFVEHEGIVLLTGYFEDGSSHGMRDVTNGGAVIMIFHTVPVDSMVTAGASFNGELVLAGLFKNVGLDPVGNEPNLKTHMINTTFGPTSSSKPSLKLENTFTIFQTGSQLNIQYTPLEQDANLQIVDLQGRVLHQSTLANYTNQHVLDLDLPAGVYVVNVQHANLNHSQKLIYR